MEIFTELDKLFKIICMEHKRPQITQVIPRKKNKQKEPKIGKEEVKLPLFADYMILYIENPKDSTRKLLELRLYIVTLLI